MPDGAGGGRGQGPSLCCCCPNFKTAFWEWKFSLLKGSYFKVGLTHLLFLLRRPPLKAERCLLPPPHGLRLPIVQTLASLWILCVCVCWGEQASPHPGRTQFVECNLSSYGLLARFSTHEQAPERSPLRTETGPGWGTSLPWAACPLLLQESSQTCSGKGSLLLPGLQIPHI